MKDPMLLRCLQRKLLAVLFAISTMTHAAAAYADTEQRVVILRERATLQLLDGAFTIQLLKIRGYTVDVRLDGEKRTLKRGQTFGPDNGACSVTFQKISPETRIARFLTDCP